MQSPVLFIIFNRPETTRQVFEAIRLARPPRLYVAADGPRNHKQEETQKCLEARNIATSVDWPCEVKTLFREKNLGCKIGVSSAIDWFFKHELEGIILEDDVLPLPSFFRYCDELLERYRNTPQVGMISGCNLVSKHLTRIDSYFFSKHNHIWGWASWRRAWKHYDVAMISWPNWVKEKGLSGISKNKKTFEAYWSDIFNRAFAGEIDTWDYQWTFACWKNNMLTVLPIYNQTYNLGFGIDATHTTMDAPLYVTESQPKLLEFPLIHPNTLNSIDAIDTLIDRKIFGVSFFYSIKNHLPCISFIRKIKRWIRS